MRARSCVAVIAICMLIPALLAAQPVAGNFDQLRMKVQAGDSIYVTDTTGHERRGRVVSLSESTLRMSFGDDAREFTERDVRLIRQRRPDPLWTGAAIGGGVGVVFGALAASIDEECSRGSGTSCAGPVLMMAGIGAGVGIGIDALIQGRKTIYEGRAAGVFVSPWLTRGSAGIRVTITSSALSPGHGGTGR
jgi:hypothetical protein